MIKHIIGKRVHMQIESGLYKCPYCHQKYADGYKYEKQILKNKSGFSRRVCFICNRYFGIASDMIRGIVGFKL